MTTITPNTALLYWAKNPEHSTWHLRPGSMYRSKGAFYIIIHEGDDGRFALFDQHNDGFGRGGRPNYIFDTLEAAQAVGLTLATLC